MTVRKPLYKSFLIIILNLTAITVSAQKEGYIQSLDHQQRWVDSVYKKMSRRRKVAQLFFIRAQPSLGPAYADSIADIIGSEKLGGVIFFKGGPVQQAALINRYQKLVKVPLLVAMDGEWGVGMRLDSTISYPYQMTLGAVQDNTLIYKMGQQVAWDFKRLGMQMNLAPDMDINNNPDNPVINYRSFGDNKYNVAAKGIAYLKGMQDAGLLTTAKHFPGHGDTNVDSHLDLPQLPFSRQRLDSLEEYPFREAIKAGISGVMIAHMNIPALDDTKNLPSTLSKPIVTGVLKDSLGFRGLVVSDAMEMKAVVKYFPNGEADVKAFLAGNDIIELSENTARAIKMIRKLCRKNGEIDKELEVRVKKILAAKYWAGLNHYQEVPLDNLVEDLNRPAARDLVQQLSDAAVTVIKGDAASLRMDPLKKTAVVSVGTNQPTVFPPELAKWYFSSASFSVPKDAQAEQLNALLKKLEQYQQIYITINDTRARPGSKLDYSNDVVAFIAALEKHPNTVTVLFANAYTLAGLPGVENSNAIVVCYQLSDYLQRSAVKVITGQIHATGKLPVTINSLFTTGLGLVL